MITIKDLKERWFNAYPEVSGEAGDKPIQCYAKKDVDECLAGIEAVPRTDNSAVIDRLLEERRWRKFSKEKPARNQCIIVCSPELSKMTGSTVASITRWDSLAEFGMQHSGFTQWTPFPKLPEAE